ncbi:phenylalanine--tRNA ligase subunit beta, partial [candidate division KSB3 bacterium]|nr:phenylalanine--tRNA ligase subunit beta [candidate division KSB3 bacterium]MBD3326371.1 phenylalanine--tRNA ligase subunit beta [candidate division KSB3 bacterium]
MKISYRWLQEYVECAQVPIAELADRLTMAGLEVEGIDTQAQQIPAHVVVGEILEVHEHHETLGLYICQVNTGEADPRRIVCGAPNTQTHVKVPVALPGAHLPIGITVQEATIRGIVSQGMICAEDELGLSHDHSGIILLHDDAPVGQPVSATLLGIEDDAVLEIGLTPNRGDCLSHLGVAREVATLLNCPLMMPSTDYPEAEFPISERAAVSIEDPDLCPRYAASVITNVTIGPSPMWLRRRLEAVGIRAINNVVDVTNYVMMELGQPLHAFDLTELEGHQIIVRRA